MTDPIEPKAKYHMSSDGQIDINAAAEVEIRVAEDGRTIWLNIDGVCAVRVYPLPEASVTVADHRKRPKKLYPKTPVEPTVKKPWPKNKPLARPETE